MRDLALNNVHLAPLNLDKFDRTEIIKNTIRECMNKLIDANLLEKRSVVRKKDTIDVSEYGKENCGGNLSALPSMEFKDEEKEALSKNWTLAVPPLLEGVVLINKDRYLVYSTSDLDIDGKKYKVFIYDYACDNGVWLLNHAVDSVINCDLKVKNTFAYHDLDISEILRGYFVDHTLEPHLELDKVSKDILTTGILPDMERDNKEFDEPRDILNHFFVAIIRVNYELSLGHKPKAVRGKSTRKVKVVNSKESEKNPKPQIIRTLPSGVTIKSVDIPKAPTVEVIRHYKIASWRRQTIIISGMK